MPYTQFELFKSIFVNFKVLEKWTFLTVDDRQVKNDAGLQFS